jgi:hypothetical protein
MSHSQSVALVRVEHVEATGEEIPAATAVTIVVVFVSVLAIDGLPEKDKRGSFSLANLPAAL